jgi:hypothetical protein
MSSEASEFRENWQYVDQKLLGSKTLRRENDAHEQLSSRRNGGEKGEVEDT